MLENVGSKLPDELTILGENLDLMSWRPLSDDDVSSLDDYRHSVGVEQLTVSLPDLSELELEIPEYLKGS